MNYYKLGLQSQKQKSARVQTQSVSGITDLPAPLPTVALYFALLGGAIVWTKSGGF